MSLMIHMLE